MPRAEYRRKLERVRELERRNPEQAAPPKEPLLGDDGGNRREHDRAKRACAPRPDHLLDDEQHRRDRRVERGRQARRRTDGGNQPQLVTRQLQPASEERRQARTNLQGRILRPERVTAADCQRACDELRDDGTEGDVAVRDVHGGLCLLDTAAARRREDEDDQRGDQQADHRGHEHDAREGRLERRPEQQQPAPFNRDAEADDREAGEDADQDGEQQKQLRLLEAGQHDAPRCGVERGGLPAGSLILRLSVPWRAGRAR